jgi:peptide/nickel transport system substrate-binding protein
MAATRPRYGGTLRLEMRERLASIDPAQKAADRAGRLQMLVYDRLTRLDEAARVQPALAISWQSDSEKKRWEFRLRPGVKFHDGYPLTPAAVSGALQRILGSGATVTAAGDAVVIQSNQPLTRLPVELARPEASISARDGDGSPTGTGPFRVARFDAGRHVTLAAYDEHWAGRPYVDAIEVEMGRSPREQFIDLQVGKADIVELAPAEIRAATERGTRTWSSAPLEILALVFGQGRAADNAKLREALALAIDRNAIHNVLLQRQGVVTGALLPQWLSGYAFLFPTGMDVVRARQLVADLPASERTLVLRYDAADSQARIIAERIAVNARDAGITLQINTTAHSDLKLVRARCSTPDAARALSELAADLGLGETRVTGGPTRPDLVYAAERTLLEGYRVIPLFHLPDTYGVGTRVKLWLRPGLTRMGWLELADLWIENAP